MKVLYYKRKVWRWWGSRLPVDSRSESPAARPRPLLRAPAFSSPLKVGDARASLDLRLQIKKETNFRWSLSLFGLGETSGEPLQVIDFIEGFQLPKRIRSESLAEIYLETALSAQQIAEQVGLSKQAVLTRLRSAGVRNSRRGRSPDNYRYPNPPFGYEVRNDKLKTNVSELRTVRLIVRLIRDERQSFDAVARSLNERKIPARQGSGWDRARVKRVYCRWHDKL